jgi:hypothetical protein
MEKKTTEGRNSSGIGIRTLLLDRVHQAALALHTGLKELLGKGVRRAVEAGG